MNQEPELLHEFNFTISLLDYFESELSKVKSLYENTHERLFIKINDDSDKCSAFLELKGFKKQ